MNNEEQDIEPVQPPSNPNADEHYHEAKMSYNADADYANKYHSDAYNPVSYTYTHNIMLDIQKTLDIIIRDNPQYDNLRLVDTSKLRDGDQIIYNGAPEGDLKTGDICIIESINEESFSVRKDGYPGSHTVRYGQVKVIEDSLLKLKGSDISFLYNTIKAKAKIESHVDFFNALSEYLRINEKLLYDSLTPTVKNEVLIELNDRTGCIKKHNKFVW
jgi:hypothetical protein